MKTVKIFHSQNLILAIILIIGAVLRFYKLDWGSGYFFHPDEYNIMTAVSNLSFPNALNPHFFAYGSIIVYLIYFSQLIISSFSQLPNPFLIGRLYSALFSTLSIFLIYKITRQFSPFKWAALAAFLAALLPGLIQQAHFATPESALIFFLLASLFFLLKYLDNSELKDLTLASLFFGLSLGVKISAGVFIIPIIFAILLKTKFSLLRSLYHLILSLGLGFLVFAMTNPFVFLDFKDFKSSMIYETSVASGSLLVFYTRQFIDTTPVLFQLSNILPFALGPVLLITGSLAFIVLIIKQLKQPQSRELLLLLSFLALFLTNAFLFAKWTRFMAPTLPFFPIFLALIAGLSYRKHTFWGLILGLSTFLGTLIWLIAFLSIYTHQDVRLVASDWIRNNISSDQKILVEGGNVLDLPLNGPSNRTSLDFYSFENDPTTREEISQNLASSDYFIIESRRVFMNHQRLPALFSKTAKLYNDLFQGKLGYQEVVTFSSFPEINLFGLNLVFPDETAEETWSVFDHPVIRIFKNSKKFNQNYYGELFKN